LEEENLHFRIFFPNHQVKQLLLRDQSGFLPFLIFFAIEVVFFFLNVGWFGPICGGHHLDLEHLAKIDNDRKKSSFASSAFSI